MTVSGLQAAGGARRAAYASTNKRGTKGDQPPLGRGGYPRQLNLRIEFHDCLAVLLRELVAVEERRRSRGRADCEFSRRLQLEHLTLLDHLGTPRSTLGARNLIESGAL